MLYDQKILLGKSGDEDVYIYPKMANRHGMIAGATGTGKTITLKVMAESFSDLGVPVFLADIKGDLAGMCCTGKMNENLQARIDQLGIAEKGFKFDAYPSTYWDVYGENGLPLRTTVSEVGPLLMGRILGLNDTQSDLLTVVYKIADDQQLLLIDTKDLKAMLNFVGEHAAEFSGEYGNISKASLNVIIRAIVALEAEGADLFFGEPALSIVDWFISCSGTEKGPIQILDCQKLINHPNMYATFMLWLMSELFETLPEVGDPEKPKMVFFFDEAHLLFNHASRALLERIEQVVKLIRSKGVGIFFITQSPKDIPDGVLAQLGNKVQHALHAYTPAEQKAVKAAAMSFRENPEFKTYDAIQELGTGEALVSVLDEKGTPTVVVRTKILPPQSQMGSLSDQMRRIQIEGSSLYRRYNDFFDRDSAYEFFQRLNAKRDAELAQAQAEKEALKAKQAAAKKTSDSAFGKAAKSVARTTGGTVGREVGKSVGKSIGGQFGKTLGGNIGSSLGRSILGNFFR